MRMLWQTGSGGGWLASCSMGTAPEWVSPAFMGHPLVLENVGSPLFGPGDPDACDILSVSAGDGGQKLGEEAIAGEFEGIKKVPERACARSIAE